MWFPTPSHEQPLGNPSRRYSRNQLLPLFVYLSSSASDSDYADFDDSAVSFPVG